jgi:hypothetical protein
MAQTRNPNIGSVEAIARTDGTPRLITFESVRNHPASRPTSARRTPPSRRSATPSTASARRARGPHRVQHPHAAGYPEREAELAAIAGYMHDIGNAVNREQHAQTGAVMAMQILTDMGMPDEEIVRSSARSAITTRTTAIR